MPEAVIVDAIRTPIGRAVKDSLKDVRADAVAARESGHFTPEIVPVMLPDGTVADADDGPRPGTTVERL